MSTAHPSTWSSRRWVVEKLAELWAKQRAGAYRVVRGPVIWGDFDFADAPRAVSINTDKVWPLGRERELCGAIVGFFAIEVFARIENPTTYGAPDGQVAEGLHDELLDDITEVLEALVTATQSPINAPGADPVLLKLMSDDVESVSSFDADAKVQGWVTTFSVTF